MLPEDLWRNKCSLRDYGRLMLANLSLQAGWQ